MQQQQLPAHHHQLLLIATLTTVGQFVFVLSFSCPVLACHHHRCHFIVAATVEWPPPPPPSLQRKKLTEASRSSKRNLHTKCAATAQTTAKTTAAEAIYRHIPRVCVYVDLITAGPFPLTADQRQYVHAITIHRDKQQHQHNYSPNGDHSSNGSLPLQLTAAV